MLLYNKISFSFLAIYIILLFNNNWFGIVEHQESNLNIQN